VYVALVAVGGSFCGSTCTSTVTGAEVTLPSDAVTVNDMSPP
jgi:hypothetical protein